MKKSLLTLLSVLFCAVTFAQNVPQGINYQAVARDSTGAELSNQTLTIKLSVLKTTSNPFLPVTTSWQETHSVTTNDYGLFTAIIGQGVTTGVGSSVTFSAIDWGSGNHYIQLEMNGVYMGTTQLMSVPYALQAGGGDNLGNHIAETTIDLDTNDIKNVRYLAFKKGYQLNNIYTNISWFSKL